MPKILTDNKWKYFKYRYEVPQNVLDQDYDHLDEDSLDGFIKYRRNWYHISDFMLPMSQFDKEFKEWHAYLSDSFFSGILIRVSDDGEQYQIATFIG